MRDLRRVLSPLPSMADPHLLLLLLLLFIPISHGLSSINTTIPNCPTFDCGDGVKIPYPFWVPAQTAAASKSFCGYLDFKVTCNGTKPSFQTISDNYTVKSIDPTNRILSLVDTDVVGKNCPRARHNVSFSDSLKKNYSVSIPPYIEYLVFLFGCNLSLYTGPKVPPEFNITCRLNESGTSYAFLTGIIPYVPAEYSSLYAACKRGSVVSPVRGGSLGNTGPGTAFPTALSGGFEVGWQQPVMEDCRKCERSGGRCGYNNQTGNGWVFQCFCRKGVHYDGDCGSGNNSKKALTIGLGVGGGVVFLVMLFIGFVCYKRHKKDAESTPTTLGFLRRGFSSDLSSFADPESVSGDYYKTPIFTYKELHEATGGFDTNNELGDGGFGVVFKGKLKDGRIVAVKRLYERNHRRVRQFRNEVEILNHLRHRNLVALYGCTSPRDAEELVLVYEYIPNGTVADHLHGSRAPEHALSWPLRLSIAIESADALTYLHAHTPQIIHRDVKTSNILLDHSFTVKVADFGLSRLFPLDVTHVSTAPQGTPGYVDPEYHQCYQLTDKSDVYSFGVVLVELISSMPAVDITRNRSEINLSNMAVDRIPRGLVSEMVDPSIGYADDPDVRRMVEQVAEVAYRCLQPERDMRPTMEEVRETLKDIAGTSDNLDDVKPREKEMRDDAHLLKTSSASPPFSPNSVADRWVSVSTTPHTSA